MKISIKSQTILEGLEEGQTDYSKARKKPNCICGIANPLSQKISNLQEYEKKYSSKLRLNLAWRCTEALTFP